MIKKIDLRHLTWHGKSAGGSIGMLPKDVIQTKDNKRYYVKISQYSLSHGVYGIESISEVIK